MLLGTTLLVFLLPFATADKILKELIELSVQSKGQPIMFTSTLFDRLIRARSSERFPIVALFTTSDSRHQCSMCAIMVNEFTSVSLSFERDEQKHVAFAVIDYRNAPSVFEQLRIDTVPKVALFWSDEQIPTDLDKHLMPFDRYKADAHNLVAWIREKTGVQVHLKPIMPEHSIASLVKLVLTLITLVATAYYFRNSISNFWWASASVLEVLIFISGQMWNQIRMPPFDAGSHHRSNALFGNYISGQSNGQFVAETYLVLTSYLVAIIGFILLDIAAAKKGKQRRTRREYYWTGLITLFVGINAISYIFVLKNRSYPYSLF